MRKRKVCPYIFECFLTDAVYTFTLFFFLHKITCSTWCLQNKLLRICNFSCLGLTTSCLEFLPGFQHILQSTFKGKWQLWYVLKCWKNYNTQWAKPRKQKLHIMCKLWEPKDIHILTVSVMDQNQAWPVQFLTYFWIPVFMY